MNIYVGNIPYNTTEDQIREMFEQFGAVSAVKMITDRDTGRFRGFAFVEMDNDEAQTAINALNDADHDGRKLQVNEAKEKTDQDRRPKRNFRR